MCEWLFSFILIDRQFRMSECIEMRERVVSTGALRPAKCKSSPCDLLRFARRPHCARPLINKGNSQRGGLVKSNAPAGAGPLASALQSAADPMWYETCGETWQGKSEGLLQRAPCILRSRVEHGAYRRETPSWGLAITRHDDACSATPSTRCTISRRSWLIGVPPPRRLYLFNLPILALRLFHSLRL